MHNTSTLTISHESEFILQANLCFTPDANQNLAGTQIKATNTSKEGMPKNSLLCSEYKQALSCLASIFTYENQIHTFIPFLTTTSENGVNSPLLDLLFFLVLPSY
jgi:hypothetical protein